MPNLLSIPFKKTYPIDIKDAARNYIYMHGGGHPDEFKDDINIWQNLRKDGVGGVVHVDRINSTLLYHAQLVSVLAKLPADIQLDIAYATVFQDAGVPITLKNIAFERCSVLFNLAALYSQLAASEDRSKIEGIKRATSNYQYAAGTLSYLRSSAIPKLIFSPDDEEIPLDLSDAFVQGLESLMLAQAQECSWQMAKLNQYKNGLISKVAARTAFYYQTVMVTFRDATPRIKHLLPPDWLPHIDAKYHHFEAVAQYRKSMDEIENSRYGVEIARLVQAQAEAKQAYEVARRGRIAPPVLQDIQSLLEAIQKGLKRAERDNDLIYHHDVPTLSALPPIAAANLVASVPPSGLSDPATTVGNTRMIFSDLVGWGANEAINIYNDRKQNLIKEKIVNVAHELQDTVDETLRLLNLPSSLEALERPVGLPPSLLRKAEEVRLENGPEKIEVSIEDVQRLAQRDLAILEEAMDILDNEASEDEAARKDAPLDRLPSHEANVELIEKERRYRGILAQAATSDETVRQKWDDWENNIIELTWSEEELEESIPSSTISASTNVTPQGKQTQIHARALRVLIETLDDLHKSAKQLIRRAQALADADDIRDRILKVSSGFERLVEVEPAMFEDVSDEELSKYDKFLKEISEIEQKQSGILSDIQSRNELFLQSRRDDPSVKDREHALQSLDLAYHKYREITRNLDEGHKFYNDLAGILLQFKEACKTWGRLRNQEIHSLSRSMQSMSIHEFNAAPSDDSKTSTANASPASRPPQSSSVRKQPVGKSSLGLPSINSSDWGFEKVELPPGPTHRS